MGEDGRDHARLGEAAPGILPPAAFVHPRTAHTRTHDAAPQREQRWTSMSNTRRKRCAHVMRARAGAEPGSAPLPAGADVGAGTTRRRWRAFGANTPAANAASLVDPPGMDCVERRRREAIDFRML